MRYKFNPDLIFIKRKKGFGLIEALLTVALFGLIVGIIASLINMAVKTSFNLREKDVLVRSLKSSLDRMSLEISEAKEIISPSPGSSSDSEILFKRMNPAYPDEPGSLEDLYVRYYISSAGNGLYCLYRESWDKPDKKYTLLVARNLKTIKITYEQVSEEVNLKVTFENPPFEAVTTTPVHLRCKF